MEAMQEHRQSVETSVESLKSRLEEVTRKLEAKEKESANIFPPISGVIKDELILISFLILFVGIISTDAYYSAFGIKYQFLHLPPFHIIYRGLTVILVYPYLLIPYSLTVLLLVIDFYAARKKWAKYFLFRSLQTYLLLGLLLALTYPLAVNAGWKGAKLDMREKSTLPRVITLNMKNATFDMTHNLRLLVADSDYVVVFKPIDEARGASSPLVQRFLKGDVYVLETTY